MTTNELIKQVPDADKSKYCQFYLGTPERYCAATCTKSCKRCRFFSPFVGEKLDILTEMVNTERKKVCQLETEKKKLKKTVECYEEMLEHPKTGKWIPGDKSYTCSECKTEFRDALISVCNYRLPNFCPECGKPLVLENAAEKEEKPC